MNRKTPHAKKYPFVSVVIPAYNEAVMLPTCLESLMEQNYKGKYEVIVVNNNSTDLTVKIAKTYGARVISEKRQGVVFARQTGFENTKGEIICSTDADTIVPPDWISKFVKQFNKNKEVVAVGGSCDLIGANTPFKLLSKSLTPFFFLADKIFDYPGTLSGWNFAVKKSSFKYVGKFNLNIEPNEIGEDRELGKRLRKIGKVKVLFGIRVKTSARRFTGFIKTFKYVFLNYIIFMFKKRSISGTFSPIRQKSYESFDAINDMPFFIFVIFLCLVVIIMVAGGIPIVNLLSFSSAKTSDKVIALTFDGGPDVKYTNQILDLLQTENVHATFFVTGDLAKKNPGVIKKEYENGNEVANYSLSNSPVLMLKTPQEIINNINDTNNIIDQIIGKKPKFFRPPSGYRTIWGGLALEKYGYTTVTWNDSSNDLSKDTNSKKITIDIIRNVKPGAIIDLHDGSINRNSRDRSQTVKAVQEIIELLQAEGYKFVTLDQLLGKPAYF